MEIRVVVKENGQPVRHSIAVTMRTPGHDFDLAAGFLFNEAIVNCRTSIRDIRYCRLSSDVVQENVVNVFLGAGVQFDKQKFSRHVYTTSSCGICGKASLEMVRSRVLTRPVAHFKLDHQYLVCLPKQLLEAQSLFARTGGLHASALFDLQGQLLLLREDVGRHNALDKLLGRLFLEGSLPASGSVLLVSGRASYELVQKALMGGVPALAALGAPSSLAVDLAREFDMLLIGFLGAGGFNVYSGEHLLIKD